MTTDYAVYFKYTLDGQTCEITNVNDNLNVLLNYECLQILLMHALLLLSMKVTAAKLIFV